MNRLFLPPEHAAGASPLRALILYDERKSGFRAKEVFDRLTGRSDGHLRFDLALYRFDLLARRSAAAEALAEASRADLLVVALRHQQPLPRTVGAWLETWAGSHARGHQALVGLPDRGPVNPSRQTPAVAALRACAARHGVTFLCPWDVDTALAWDGFADDLDQRAHAMTPTLRSLMDRTRTDACARWDLNA